MIENSEHSNHSGARRLALMLAAVAAVGMGIFGIAFGSFWAPTALAFFAGREVVQNFELIVPFVPISAIALGAYLAVQARL